MSVRIAWSVQLVIENISLKSEILPQNEKQGLGEGERKEKKGK